MINRVGSGHNTGKTVAIILGGAAGVGFLVMCLLVVKNATKKHDGECLWPMSRNSSHTYRMLVVL